VRGNGRTATLDDDDLTLIVHEQVEKALTRVRGRVLVGLFATMSVLAIVYSATRDFLALYLSSSAIVGPVVAAISCRGPLSYGVEDVCRLHELQPGNGDVLIMLGAMAAFGTVGFSILVYYAGVSLRLIWRVYGYYLVGDIRYTGRRFLWIGFGVVGAIFNTVAQGLSAHYRSYHVERTELHIAPNERFLLTLGSIWFLYWVLFQIFQFALFAGLVGLKRYRARPRVQGKRS